MRRGEPICRACGGAESDAQFAQRQAEAENVDRVTQAQRSVCEAAVSGRKKTAKLRLVRAGEQPPPPTTNPPAFVPMPDLATSLARGAVAAMLYDGKLPSAREARLETALKAILAKLAPNTLGGFYVEPVNLAEVERICVEALSK